MNKTNFYVELIFYIEANGERAFRQLFDLHEQLKPTCTLADVNELFNEVGTYANMRVRRRIFEAAHKDICQASMRVTDQWVLAKLHRLLVPEYPYANSRIRIRENNQINVQQTIKNYFRKFRTFCFGSK